MPDTGHTTRTHRSHRPSRKHSRYGSKPARYPEPVYYFSGAIVFLVIVMLLHASMLPSATGVTGIILLSISKLWKFRTGAIISILCLLAMAMLFNWHWADHYFPAIISGEITSKEALFVNGFIDSLIPVFLLWLYYRQLMKIHDRSGQKWFVKKSFIVFFRLLVYFQLFLVIFWVLTWFALKAQPITSLDVRDSGLIAGALALLSAGIPAIIYISKGSPAATKRHGRHRHHHRRGTQANSQE